MISVSLHTSGIARLFDDEIAIRLIHLGFPKCPSGHYRKDLAPGVFGHFGYALYTDRRTGEVRAWPVVGVRFQSVEKLLSELREKEFDEYGTFTIGRPLGFFMEQWDLAEWSVDSPNDLPGVADEVVAALQAYGMPFITSHTSLQEAISVMSPENFGGGHDGEKLAASYFLLGEYEKARCVLNHQAERYAKGNYPGAEDFRQFARNLRERIDSCSG